MTSCDHHRTAVQVRSYLSRCGVLRRCLPSLGRSEYTAAYSTFHPGSRPRHLRYLTAHSWSYLASAIAALRIGRRGI